MKQFFGITNTKAGLIGDFESGFKEQTQEELNEINNKKLPLGLTMTPDGQNIDPVSYTHLTLPTSDLV